MVKVVSEFHPVRYSGLWYEAAKIPNEFESDCYSATAFYGRPNRRGRVSITNTCYDRRGGHRSVSGTLFSPEVESAHRRSRSISGKLKVRIGDNVSDYWVIETDYRYYSIVGSSNGLIWLLTRRTRVDYQIYRRFRRVARDQGYDHRLIRRSGGVTFLR